MMKQPSAFLFLAEPQELVERTYFRRASLFPCGGLQAVHEETLTGGQVVNFPVEQAYHVLLIPLRGAVWVGGGHGVSSLVHNQEMYSATVPAGSVLHFTNPYATKRITFLHLWVAYPQPMETPATRLYAFDTQYLTNQLLEVAPFAPELTSTQAGLLLPFRVSLGKFAGWVEATYYRRSPAAQVFAYVLAGALLVEGQLLRAKEGLTFRNTEQVTLEAISTEAFVLVLEVDG